MARASSRSNIGACGANGGSMRKAEGLRRSARRPGTGRPVTDEERQATLGAPSGAGVSASGLIALPSYADLRPPARPRATPPMRFVRVRSADPACEPNCPEWLSAEGRIEPGSARASRMRLRSSKAAGCRSSSIRRAARSPMRGPWANSFGQGPRGRRRPDADHQLSGSLAEMPGRPRQGDRRRGDLRLGVRVRARRRG